MHYRGFVGDIIDYLGLFSADFHSGLVARSCGPIKWMMKALLKMQALPDRPEKANS